MRAGGEELVRPQGEGDALRSEDSGLLGREWSRESDWTAEYTMMAPTRVDAVS